MTNGRLKFRHSTGASTIAWLLLIGLVVLGIFLLRWLGADSARSSTKRSLLVYCAAGIKTPVESAAEEFERRHNVRIELQYGGSQTLLASARVTRRGDLYLPADASYLELAGQGGLITETIPLARMHAVIGVAVGNPKKVKALGDLLQPGIRIAHANPEAAAIGKLTRAMLDRTGQWEKFKEQIIAFKPTVNDVANDIKLGAVDAGLIWDAVALQYSAIEIVRDPNLETVEGQIAVGVMRSSSHPDLAREFARFLAAPEGQRFFQKHGYQPVGALSLN